jgi:hypothetical protein
VEIRRKKKKTFLGGVIFFGRDPTNGGGNRGKHAYFSKKISSPVLDATHPETPGKRRKKYTYRFIDRDMAT